MKIYSADRSELMDVESFSRDGNNLQFQGKIMGAMPVTAVVTPEAVRALIKQMGFKILFFAFTMLFRKSSQSG